MPKPSRIIPIALIRPKINSLRLFTTVSGSVAGAAWTEARVLNETAGLLPYGGLCARLDVNKFGNMSVHSGDGYHDGDIGGGQLLNAYVWYMTITVDTDLSDSAYAPVYQYVTLEYPISEDMINMLKTAAMSVMK